MTEEDESIILTPVQTGEDAKLRTWRHKNRDDCDETELGLGSPIMIFGNVHFDTVPAIDFQVLLIPTSPLESAEHGGVE